MNIFHGRRPCPTPRRAIRLVAFIAPVISSGFLIAAPAGASTTLIGDGSA
jgi:hypothetical protein